MTDRDIREWRRQYAFAPYSPEWKLATEILAYRRAARRLRKAYGRYGPRSSGMGVLTEAVCDVLAVGRVKR